MRKDLIKACGFAGSARFLASPDMNQHKRSVYGAAAPKDPFPSLRMTPPDTVSIVRALGVIAA